MKHFRIVGSLVSLTLLPTLAVASGLFSDVPNDHPFKGEIESLARSQVIHGNPDGKFYPDRSVNRAEFLKLLYLATSRKPKAIFASCFTDVEHASWYESYVCDAASKDNGFVQGYGDGKFHPSNPVTRTEALKMIFMLFNLDAREITQQDKDIIKFVDISTSAWYSRYISAAYMNGMLPITGQSGVRFLPDQPLLRGEAAAYIFNGQKALDRQMTAQQTPKSAASSSVSSSDPGYIIKDVVFPFSDADKFTAKKPIAYAFTLVAKTEFWVQVAVSGYYPSDVTCRLYLLDQDGFSNEYYLGNQQNGTCTLKVMARPGKYQLQIQPTVENVPFTVSAKTAYGDGNDGFIESVSLQSGTPQTAILESGDLMDWYTFTVTKDTTATVEVSAGQKLDCIIYTPASVDQFGFAGPQCGVPFTFQPGDPVEPYYIGVSRHTSDPAVKVPYTVKWAH